MGPSGVGFLELSYMQTQVAFTRGIFFALGDVGPSATLMEMGRPVNPF